MRKLPPPPRKKVHWDYVLEEMHWLATDFIEERHWKTTLANHIAHTIVAYHQSQDKSNFLIKKVKSRGRRSPFVISRS